jgi:hypothetical protein
MAPEGHAGGMTNEPPLSCAGAIINIHHEDKQSGSDSRRDTSGHLSPKLFHMSVRVTAVSLDSDTT